MKNWDSSDEEGMETCPIDQDRLHMQEVCKVLGMHTVEVVSNNNTGHCIAHHSRFFRLILLKSTGTKCLHHRWKHTMED